MGKIDMNNTVDDKYMDLVYLYQDLIDNKLDRLDRTGVGTYSLFSPGVFSVNITKTFPLLSVKKINFHHIIHEVIWMLTGDTNVKYLNDNNVHIWDDWADKLGNLGPVYGKQWRAYEGPDGEVDQIAEVIKTLKTNPYSRRNLIIGVNPANKPKVAPQGCHTLCQFYYEEIGGLEFVSCQVYQRSGDLMIGIPYDIAIYGLLLEIICQEVNMIPKDVKFVFGDLHVYKNHVDGYKQLIQQDIERKRTRDLQPNQIYPKLKINNWNGINNISADNFVLEEYLPQKFIKFPIAV